MKFRVTLLIIIAALALGVRILSIPVFAEEEGEYGDTTETRQEVSEDLYEHETEDQTRQVVVPQQTETTTTTATPGISQVFPWAWIVTRAAGLASYILLGLLTITGIMQSTGVFYRFAQPATAWSIHRAIASSLLVSIVVHVLSLLFDTFIHLHIQDILIPFVSSYRPVMVALGIFGFYMMLLVLWTSLYNMTSHPRFWRIIHYLGFPMFLMIFLHGILIGTDVPNTWIRILYWGMGAMVMTASLYRVLLKYFEPKIAKREADR